MLMSVNETEKTCFTRHNYAYSHNVSQQSSHYPLMTPAALGANTHALYDLCYVSRGTAYE